MRHAAHRYLMILEAGVLFAGALFILTVGSLARAMWRRVRVA